MLRRDVQFKPFVLPVKTKPAMNEPQKYKQDGCHTKDAENNRQALRNGSSLSVKRLPFLSFLVMEPKCRAQHVRRPFKSPCAEGFRSEESNRLLQVKTLGMRRRWSSNVLKPMKPHGLPPLELNMEEADKPVELKKMKIEMPIATDALPPLVLWQSDTDPELKVVVPEIVGKFLRPHQRKGVQFMFDCVCQVKCFDGQGCILADDMGLGKTLQSITLMYTLLKTGIKLHPTVNRVIIVCPTSLVKNWDDEIIKWLRGHVKTVALYEAKREKVIEGINQFIEGSKSPRPGLSPQVLIISYETFRMHAQKFADTPSCCELLICDEAHRLKNANSQIYKALSSLPCRKRVLLSGTPMQNDLEEFFAMVDFTNPNILGSPNEFRKNYLGPILIGREPDSTNHERGVALSCSAMLCEIVNQFILRRGNILNAKHLPPKLTQTLDVVSALCRERHLPFVRLDGTTSTKKRKILVDTFNDPTTNSFAFLLSSKAGGCGLNLIGANRLVLFDPDWNPATDKQAAARVWREGQKKMCYVYRFLATGTLEEKIFQRQLSKEGLQNIVDDKEEVNSLSSKDLKRLFVFRKDTMSDTHDQLKCERCQWQCTLGNGLGAGSSVITFRDGDENGKKTQSKTFPDNETLSDSSKDTEEDYHPQIGMPPEEDLNNWGHHRSYASVDDEVMQAALQQVQNKLVSFAFSCRIDWELLQAHQAENDKKELERGEERKHKRLEKIEAANSHRGKERKCSASKKNMSMDESEVEYSSEIYGDDTHDEVLGESDSDDSDNDSENNLGLERSFVESEVDVLYTSNTPLRHSVDHVASKSIIGHSGSPVKTGCSALKLKKQCPD
ncbi:hypothetical protein PsorP6_008499 [Peronosclerospora sorghi]|uniref:Uncharacterized protein n=1 Tax=Peronosclerospora sorghi TaxID=230839 RepID=A0ACC0WAC3_9STRA|nr:hypothetical protein PsorP6_008499 [Peronosclerospora sorghi]